MVDDADYDAVMQFKWFAQKKINRGFYAARNTYKDGKRGYQYLHQFLLPGVPEIDHADGDGLNDQRHNLRPATHQQNCRGFRYKKIGASSRFRGVSWSEERQKWEAKLKADGKTIHMGRFTIEEDAARARDKATLKYYGPDAQFNFPI